MAVAAEVYTGCCPEPATTTGIHQDFLITSQQPGRSAVSGDRVTDRPTRRRFEGWNGTRKKGKEQGIIAGCGCGRGMHAAWQNVDSNSKYQRAYTYKGVEGKQDWHQKLVYRNGAP